MGSHLGGDMFELSFRNRRWVAASLGAAAIVAIATPSSAQLTLETSSSAQPAQAKAHNVAAKKKKKPAPTPDAAPSVAATPAPSTASATNSAQQAQNPLTPLYSIINENDTNFGVGPLRGTQNVLLVEPVTPIRLTPDFNLVTRWITPVIREPALAPSIPSEFGLGNVQPQFFFTPAHQGDGFVWSLGPNLWLPTATDKTLGVNRFGGGADRSCAGGSGTLALWRPRRQRVGWESRVERDGDTYQSADPRTLFLL